MLWLTMSPNRHSTTFVGFQSVCVFALPCVGLHCVAWCCIVFRFNVLRCMGVHRFALHCVASPCVALRSFELHCVAWCYVALPCVALHSVALHCVCLHFAAFDIVCGCICFPTVASQTHFYEALSSDKRQHIGCISSGHRWVHSGRPLEHDRNTDTIWLNSSQHEKQ